MRETREKYFFFPIGKLSNQVLVLLWYQLKITSAKVFLLHFCLNRMLSSTTSVMYKKEARHKSTNRALQEMKAGKGKQVSHRESQCSPLTALGFFR